MREKEQGNASRPPSCRDVRIGNSAVLRGALSNALQFSAQSTHRRWSGSSGDAGEEGCERRERRRRRLLGQIMPAVERRAGRVAGPVAPDAEDVIPAPDLALRAPQREERAGDLARRLPVDLVEGE